MNLVLTRGREGVQNPENLADVICACPLRSILSYPIRYLDQNEACDAGSSSRNGTCYTSAECTALGGASSGTCASGYGVCCICKIRSNPVVPQRHLTSPFRLHSPDVVRDVLEPEQHVPGGDGGDVDVALALRLRGLQGQQRHLPDQV